MKNDTPIILNKVGIAVSTAWLQELSETIEATYYILDDLKKAGYLYKRVSRIMLCDCIDPVWIGETESEGYIKINPGIHDARSIAHEIGHGFEERWRLKTSEVMGQSMAEAIRYFVEKRMGASTWKPNANWRIVLKLCCEDYDIFKGFLNGPKLHELYP